MDSRDLCYDPRGWWRHAQALHAITSAASGRLHRPSRGLSSSGLPWGAGSLNEPLEGVNGGRISSAGGTLGTLSGNIAGEAFPKALQRVWGRCHAGGAACDKGTRWVFLLVFESLPFGECMRLISSSAGI